MIQSVVSTLLPRFINTRASLISLTAPTAYAPRVSRTRALSSSPPGVWGCKKPGANFFFLARQVHFGGVGKLTKMPRKRDFCVRHSRCLPRHREAAPIKTSVRRMNECSFRPSAITICVRGPDEDVLKFERNNLGLRDARLSEFCHWHP